MKIQSYRNSFNFLIAVLLPFLFILSASAYSAVPDTPPGDTGATAPLTSPVILGGQELFAVQGFKTLTPEQRARAIAGRIRKVAEDLTVRSGSITTVDTDISTDVIAGDQIILSVTDKDAEASGRIRQDLAGDYAKKILTAVERYRYDYSRERILQGTIYAVIATIAFFILLVLRTRLFRRLNNYLGTKYETSIRGLQIKSVEIVRAQQIKAIVNGLVKLFRVLTIVFLVYFYMYLLLSFFPWTRPFAGQLMDYILVPLKMIGLAIIREIPNLFFIAVLVVVTRFILKFIHVFFKQVENGTITLTGFYPEWAKPTDQILTFALIAFAAVVAFPFIPGSESGAFKGVSIFIGVLFSLGSQSAVSNIIGGLVMTYRRAFKVGDRIKISDITGDVTDIKLQLTRIRTIKNEEVIVPNSTILNSNITNYSSLAREKGLILHTSITIGYDTPWRQVHALLLNAAERTQDLLKEPPPFVLQTSLNDFYVAYELNVYSDRPHDMVRIYSELHKNIQDCFNEYGVQIMSPHYLSDPSGAKIVPKDKWFEPPAKRPGKERDS